MNNEGDVVLIYYEDKPSVYARIEAIEPDVKKDWYQVTLLILTIPAQTATWILREEYINGETFTMSGQPMRLDGVKRVPVMLNGEENRKSTVSEQRDNKPCTVIPFKRH